MARIIKCPLCGKKTGKQVFVDDYIASNDNRIRSLCHNCKSIHFNKINKENNYTYLPLTIKAMEWFEGKYRG